MIWLLKSLDFIIFDMHATVSSIESFNGFSFSFKNFYNRLTPQSKNSFVLTKSTRYIGAVTIKRPTSSFMLKSLLTDGKLSLKSSSKKFKLYLNARYAPT